MISISPTLITMLKSIAIILDVVMAVALMYFSRGLRWREEKDRPSIVGFGWMIAGVMLSVVCMLI